MRNRIPAVYVWQLSHHWDITIHAQNRCQEEAHRKFCFNEVCRQAYESLEEAEDESLPAIFENRVESLIIAYNQYMWGNKNYNAVDVMQREIQLRKILPERGDAEDKLISELYLHVENEMKALMNDRLSAEEIEGIFPEKHIYREL